MIPSKVFLKSLFGAGTTYQVPFFQRSYVWDQREWKRMLGDMQKLSLTKKEFFLGAIILKSLDEEDESIEASLYSIVDGQQRLTSLLLLLKVLSLKEVKYGYYFDSIFTDTNTHKPYLEHSYVDRQAFENILSLSSLEDITSQNQIVQAYNYFKNNISSYHLDFDTIIKKAVMVCIKLGPKENEQEIFETINSMGRKLTTGELLKNHIFDETMISDYEKIWLPVFEKDDECMAYWASTITAGRTIRNNTEGFFHTFLQIKMGDKSLNVSADDKKEFRIAKPEAVFINYQTLIEKYIKRENILPFVKELAEYAQIYRESFEVDIRYHTIPKAPSIERMNFIIYSLDATTLIAYVLYIVKNVSDEEERNKIFEYIESYFIRRTICKEGNDDYSNLFNEQLIGNEIKTYEALKKYIDDRKDANVNMPSDEKVIESFHKSKLNNNRSRAVLFLLESKLRDKKYGVTLLPCNSYTLEHLMPKKWREKWAAPQGFTEEERDDMIDTLGNMCLLTSALNSSISNAEWDVKKNGTPRYGGMIRYNSAMEIWCDALSLPVWDETTIQERAEKLGKMANSVWKQ